MSEIDDFALFRPSLIGRKSNRRHTQSIANDFHEYFIFEDRITSANAALIVFERYKGP